MSTIVDSWQKSAQPDWYTNNGGFLWEQLTGVFKNTATNQPDHIDNCDGNQALWLFAVPQVGLFQDYDSIGGTNETATHAFNATFEAGNAYRLTVGVIGGGGNMAPGTSLEISLYFRDNASTMVPVAAITITNTPDAFPTTTHLVDYDLRVPVVKAGDAWAGQHIGVQLMSTVSSNLAGGYWDLDNVRLVATAPPALLDPVWTNGHFQSTLRGEPGLTFEILASSNLTLPRSNWTSLGTFTNLTGTTPFADAAAGFDRRFYFARQVP